MAGRGYGGKNNSSLTYEQLQSMGIGRGEGPGPTLAPPPLYSKLENPPLPLTVDASMDYMLILKKQFIDYLQDSVSYVQPEALKPDIERYSDKYKVLSNDKSDKVPSYCWSRMPKELRPLQERRGNKQSRKRKLSKQLDVTIKLKKLEELEQRSKSENEKGETENADKNSSDEEENVSDKEEDEDPDEEMDDNTDYLNNYFDNGEGYDDEDDNLDEGPVY